MSTYTAQIHWHTNDAPFTYDTYDRTHRVTFGSGTELMASSAPEFLGDATKVNPEEQLVAALSSCHMLTFLAIAARKRMVVIDYEDDAVGEMTKNDAGKLWVSKVTLRPRVQFASAPTTEQLAALHASAHRECFIANSVKTDVVIEPPA